MKYSVSVGNVITEFATYEEAESYAVLCGQPTASVVSVPDDPPQYVSSSFEIYEQKVAAGYPVPNTPYALALGDTDRAQFSAMLMLVRELLDAGYITNETTHSIKDKDDNIFEVTTQEFRQMMIGYGIYYKQIWNECSPES